MIALRVLVSAALCVAVPAAAAVQDAPAAKAENSVLGTWTGSMGNGEFTFEFSKDQARLSGRVKSHRTGRWLPLENVVWENGKLAFRLNSQPVSTFTLQLDAANGFLSGNAVFGDDSGAPMPIKLERAAPSP